MWDKTMQRNFFFAAIMMCGLSAYGQDGKTDKNGVIEKPVLADTPDAFAEQVQRIHEDMQPAGRYEFIRASDKRRVEVLLGQMATLLRSAGSVEAMNHDNRVSLFNSQEEINGILKHHDSNRLVCESYPPIGSHIPVTTCRTYRQIEEGRRDLAHARGDMTNLTRGSTAHGENACIRGEPAYCPGGGSNLNAGTR